MHLNEAHFCEDSGLGCCSSIRAMAALISRKEGSMAPCPGMVLMGLGSASKGRQGELKRREAWRLGREAEHLQGRAGYVGHHQA